MMMHEPDELTSIAAIAAKVARKYVDIDDNSELIIVEAQGLALEAESEALLTDELPTPGDLLSDWIRKEIKSSADKRQRSLKSRLRGRQGMLDLGDDFDSILTVCSKDVLGEGATSGRMTTLGLFNANDYVLIAAGSRENRKSVDRADDELQRAAAHDVPMLKPFPNYAAYYRYAARESS